jgi:uncharacterized membrane protein
MTVQRKRHIAKAISYRLLGSVQTVIIGYVLTGSVYISSIAGGVELIVKPVLYYMHERIWYRWIKFGLINKDKE